MKKLRIFTFMMALLLATTMMLSACSEAEQVDGEESGTLVETATEAVTQGADVAPDIVVTDRNGNAVKLSDYRGTPVVLNFWATWCPPCRAEMPDFDAAAEAYGDEVCFLMVNLTDGIRDTVASAADFIDEQGYTFPIYFDTTGTAANTYRVYGIPTTVFINAEGEIVARYEQMLSADILESEIAKIME